MIIYYVCSNPNSVKRIGGENHIDVVDAAKYVSRIEIE